MDTPINASANNSSSGTNILPLVIIFIFFIIIVVLLCIFYFFSLLMFSVPYYPRDPMTRKPVKTWQESYTPVIDYGKYTVSLPNPKIRPTYNHFNEIYCSDPKFKDSMLCVEPGTHKTGKFSNNDDENEE